MITGSELLADLENVKKKSQLIKERYSSDMLWQKIDEKLDEIVKLIKMDMRIYGYK